MQRYEAAAGHVIADKVIAARGAGASHWRLVTAGGHIASFSHDQVADTGVKVGDYLVYGPDGKLAGSVKAAVFEALFSLKRRAAA